MRLLMGTKSKWRLWLSAIFLLAVICELEAKIETTSTTKKPKLGRTTIKRQRVETDRAKIKPTAAAQTKTSLTQVVGRGLFKKVGETLSVQTGDTLSLRCRGKPVQWSVPPNVEEDEDEGRLMIIQQEKFSSLTLVNTTVADTGEYTCYPMYCEDKDCRRVYNKAVKVFIFFPDPRELFVPSSNHYEMIQLRRNWPAVLPCQVTSPEAKVTLHREFPPGEVPVDGTEISFNNRKGFTIHRPQLHHAGVMQCVALLGNLRQSSTKYILIYVNYPIAPPAPVIKASSSSVTVGDNLRVTCAAAGERDVLIEFNWEYPGQQIGRPLYTEETRIPVSGDASQLQFQSVLQVDEVRDVDQGTYTCTAQNLQGAKSVSTTVKVLPKAKAKKESRSDGRSQ
ncbi:PREDICTED: platelet-derived growth factor receptor-like protein [Cyprinodon variegatus]|uniref:Platelet-derived growth factor receptor-like protein n=1 Tax=Cyprinodon variegatus TaxID=28743 RepID=A0A3Q2E5X4_CYPVA|nr:PREDICTED: platelet-derived growth factor receptor-like protein [Cyprinodon variegatus]